MIVSTAIAVLPVWRSPMINSLCPLPIGTRLSTAFNPVCIGSWTDFLGIIPGALSSTLCLLEDLIAPAPSIGLLEIYKYKKNKIFRKFNLLKFLYYVLMNLFIFLKYKKK